METLPPPVRRIDVEREPTIVTTPLPQRSHTFATRADVPAVERMTLDALSVAYGAKLAVKEVSLRIRQGEVLALIGPSGCGKTTLLRTLNRLTELTPTARRSGRIALDGTDVDALEVTDLRKRVTMVFQQPNPFPMSIFDNVAYAIREQGRKKPGKAEVRPKVEHALQRAGLWDEVSHDLDHPALRLSGGQQQRLCIARALAAEPEVLLMDEPCSALDPTSTARIEELIGELRRDLAIVIVTHNLQQAYRVADHVAFMYLGDLVEYGPAEQVFTAPRAERTRAYVSGAFG
jgi:phosphate transport system ATP-binding protein